MMFGYDDLLGWDLTAYFDCGQSDESETFTEAMGVNVGVVLKTAK